MNNIDYDYDLYNEFPKIIGTVCASGRKAAGLTQQRIADIAGYTRAHISSFETGRRFNLNVFLTYIKLGLIDYNKLFKGVSDYGK